MDDDLSLGLIVIVVLCFIVIAMSVHKMAFASEYFSVSDKNDVRYKTELQQSMFDNAEPPVFYNFGSAADINNSLQAAAKKAPDSSSFGNRSGMSDNNLQRTLEQSMVGL